MKKLSIILLLIACAFYVHATESVVSDVTITHIEFYGNQFTIHLDKEHAATGCGHPSNKVVAIVTNAEPGKTHYSALLAIWLAGKNLTLRVSDSTCSGDRPTLLNWSAY